MNRKYAPEMPTAMKGLESRQLDSSARDQGEKNSAARLDNGFLRTLSLVISTCG